MTTLVNWENDIQNNPLHRLEMLLLNRRRGKWFWWGIIGLTLFIFMLPVLWNQAPDFNRAMDITLVLLMMINLAAMLTLIFRASAFGTTVLARELTGQTWEMLILTGVDARRLVVGKWLGVMRYLLRDAGWLIALRLCVLFWGMVRHQTDIQYSYWQMQNLSLGDAVITVWWIPQMLVLTTVFVLLELALSSALGLLTAMRRQRISSGVSLLIRFGIPGLIIAGAVMAIGLSQHNCYMSTNYNYGYCSDIIEPTVEALAMPGFAVATFFDNANFSAFFLLDAQINPRPNTLSADEVRFFYQTIIGGYVLTGLIYLLGTAGAIWGTIWRVQRLGANKTGFMYKQKPKREYQLADEPKPTSTAVSNMPKAVEIEPVIGESNLLQLTTPEAYTVELFSYQKAFKRAILKVFGKGEDFFLEFHNVSLLNAPVVASNASLAVHAGANSGSHFTFQIGEDITIAANSLVKRSTLH